MKKFLRIIAFLAGGVVALALVLVATVYLASSAKLRRTHAIQPRPVTIPADEAAVARGGHIASTRGCVDCHGRDFSGGKVMDDRAMGRIYGPNITPGRGSSTIGYRDEDWIRAIRHGVTRDGRGLFIMPSDEYSRLTDEDLGCLIAFLKKLPAVNRERVELEFGPVTRVLLTLEKMKLAAELIDHPNVRPPSVTKAPTVEYGRYLAYACIGCHGPNFSGGRIEIGPPSWPPARNLTKHTSGNLVQWSEADFMRAIRQGRRPDGSELSPVMPRGFGGMDDIELGALWRFLGSLPPVPTGSR